MLGGAVHRLGETSAPMGADPDRVAAKLVECLNCGEARPMADRAGRPQWLDECGRCGYHALRETTLEQRRVPVATW